MSARVPTARIGVHVANVMRGAPVVSGEHNDDEAFGYRGLVSEAHFAYAEGRVYSAPAINGITQLLFDDSTSDWQPLCPQVEIYTGADRVTLDAWVDCEAGEVRLVTNVTNGASDTATVRETLELSVDAEPGANRWHLQYRRTGGDFKVYHWVVLERRLVAGDLPL